METVGMLLRKKKSDERLLKAKAIEVYCRKNDEKSLRRKHWSYQSVSLGMDRNGKGMRMRTELGMGMEIELVFNLAAHSSLGFNFNLSLDLDLGILTTTHITIALPFKDVIVVAIDSLLSKYTKHKVVCNSKIVNGEKREEYD
ncbi:unnamed protein product [Wuchereria bancrofti]|uniref:Uncharacterized protein n=1 Tax=Wuchereria bancrofti TaxID=6293 RepID=A0A3P7F720_WUCBA|nr:unnamed protein product [Wuchereria bancrofti]